MSVTLPARIAAPTLSLSLTTWRGRDGQVRQSLRCEDCLDTDPTTYLGYDEASAVFMASTWARHHVCTTPFD